MGKVCSSKSDQSLISLAHAFDDITVPDTVGIAVKEKSKGKIDGMDRKGVTILDRRSEKHGASAALYHFSDHMKNNHEKAEKAIRELLVRFLREHPAKTTLEAKAIVQVMNLLARSKEQGRIRMDGIDRQALKTITDAIETEAQKSVALVVEKDLHVVDNGITHFVDDVTWKNRYFCDDDHRKIVEQNAFERAGKGGNQKLLRDIGSVSKHADELRGSGKNSQVASRLKLRPPSFTAAQKSKKSAQKKTNLLDKIADWPGADLQQKTAQFFESSRQSADFKNASKELLLVLAEQESYLALVNHALTTDLEKIEKDRELWESFGKNVGKLLADIRKDNSPFARLRKLAVLAYNSPVETARAVADQTSKLLPVPDYAPPPLVIPGANPPPIWKGGPPPTTLPSPLFFNNSPPPSDNPPLLQPVIEDEEQPLDNQGAGNQPQPSNSGNSALASNNQLPPAHKGEGDAGPLRPLPLIPEHVSKGAPSPGPKPLVSAQQSSNPGAAKAAVHNVLPSNDAQLTDLVPPLSVKERVAQLEAGKPPGSSPNKKRTTRATRPLPNPLSEAEQPNSTSNPVQNKALPSAVVQQPEATAPLQNEQLVDWVPPGTVNKRLAQLSAAKPGGSSQNKMPQDNNAPPIVVVSQPKAPQPTSAEASLPSLEPLPLVQSAQLGSQPPQSNSLLPFANGLNLNPPPPDDEPPPPQLTVPPAANGGMPLADLPPIPDAPPPAVTLLGKAQAHMLPQGTVVVGGDQSVPPPDYMPAPPANAGLASLLPPIPDLPPELPFLKSGNQNSPAPTDIPPPPFIEQPVAGSQPVPGNLLPSPGEITMLEAVEMGTAAADAEIEWAAAKMKRRVLYTQPSHPSSEITKNKDLNEQIGSFGEKMNARIAAAAKKIKKEMKDLGRKDREERETRNKNHEQRLIDNATRGAQMASMASDIAANADENRLRVSERQKEIRKLYVEGLEAPLSSPQVAVDEFIASDGEELRVSSGKDHYFKRMIDQFYSHMRAFSPKLSESMGDLSNKSTAEKERILRNNRNDKLINKITVAGKLAGDIEPKIPNAFPEFERETSNFILQRPELEFLMPKGFIAKEILAFTTGAMVAKNNLLIGNLFARIGNEEYFKLAADETVKTMKRQFDMLAFLARLLTDEEYIRIFPDEIRASVREFGSSIQEFTVDVLNPDAPFLATYRLAEAAQKSPRDVMWKLHAALTPLPPSDLPEPPKEAVSAPPNQTPPPIPTGVPLNQELGAPPAVQPPLPTSVLSSNPVETA